QHVIVERPEHAAAGFALVREQKAGRCGFLIAQPSALAPAATSPSKAARTNDLVALSSVVRATGAYAHAIRLAMGDGWIADSYDAAAEASRRLPLPVVTREGDVFRGPHLVTGGSRDDARGILATKREMKELRERIQVERDPRARLAEEPAALEATIAQAEHAIAAINAEQHKQEKAIVGHELTLQRAVDEATRLVHKGEQLARERGQAEEERDALD